MNQINLPVGKIHTKVIASGLEICENTLYKVEDLEQKVNNTKGLNFIHVKCGNDEETPIEVVKVNKFQ